MPQPDRPRDRGHRPARRGGRAVHDRRAAATPTRSRPRWSGSATARTLLMPLGDMHGIGPGNPVTATGRPFRVPVGASCSDACSTASAGRSTAGQPETLERRPTTAAPPSPLSRTRITERLSLGVRALDGFVPCGTRPAARHLRRLGRRQVDAARDDRARDVGGRERDLPRRRARPRGARVRRARPRRRPRALGRRRRHVGRARARADQGRARRDDDRRVVPRPRATTCC